MPTPIAQPWHKAYWSMKERKRLLDEYATGQQQRELEAAKGKADIAEKVNERGDERQYQYQSRRDAAENDRTLSRMAREYDLRGGLMKSSASIDAGNRMAELNKQAELAAAAAERDRKDKEALLSAQMKMDQDAEQAKIDRARKEKKAPLVGEAREALLKSGIPIPDGMLDVYANELGDKAYNALESGALRRSAAVDQAVIKNPNLALPGFGAVSRDEVEKGELQLKRDAIERSMPSKTGGGGGGGARVLKPGERIAGPPPKQKRTPIDDFNERYGIEYRIQ